MPVLVCTATGSRVALGRIASVDDLRSRAVAAFGGAPGAELCFAAVDIGDGEDEWVSVGGNKKLSPIETDADLVCALSCGAQEIIVHGAAGESSAAIYAAPPAVGPVEFTLNGKRVAVDNADPRMSLLDYLRAAGHTGTKSSCRQGGCGACTVMMDDGLAINACLRPLVACDGHTITTTEGTGNGREGYSKVHKAIAEGNGSQCGFCTPVR